MLRQPSSFSRRAAGRGRAVSRAWTRPRYPWGPEGSCSALTRKHSSGGCWGLRDPGCLPHMAAAGPWLLLSWALGRHVPWTGPCPPSSLQRDIRSSPPGTISFLAAQMHPGMGWQRGSNKTEPLPCVPRPLGPSTQGLASDSEQNRPAGSARVAGPSHSCSRSLVLSYHCLWPPRKATVVHSGLSLTAGGK